MISLAYRFRPGKLGDDNAEPVGVSPLWAELRDKRGRRGRITAEAVRMAQGLSETERLVINPAFMGGMLTLLGFADKFEAEGRVELAERLRALVTTAAPLPTPDSPAMRVLDIVGELGTIQEWADNTEVCDADDPTHTLRLGLTQLATAAEASLKRIGAAL